MKKKKLKLPKYKNGGKEKTPKTPNESDVSLATILADPVTQMGLGAFDLAGKLVAGNKAGSTALSGVPVIGGFSDAIFGKDLQKEAERKENQRLMAVMQTQSNSIIDANNDTEDGSMYNTKGVYRANRYKFGGTVPLSSKSQAVVGSSHEQGGVPLDMNMDGQPDIEAEGGETVEQLSTGEIGIASDSVINPKTNRTFADDFKVLTELERKL